MTCFDLPTSTDLKNVTIFPKIFAKFFQGPVVSKVTYQTVWEDLVMQTQRNAPTVRSHPKAVQSHPISTVTLDIHSFSPSTKGKKFCENVAKQNTSL